MIFYQVDARRNGEKAAAKPIFGEIGNRMYATWPNGSPNTNTDTYIQNKTILNSTNPNTDTDTDTEQKKTILNSTIR